MWLVAKWCYTRSVGITPLLIGCSATEQVQCLLHGPCETDLECVNGKQLSAVMFVVGGGAPDL